MYIKGIDVSYCQEYIDWAKVYEDGIRFAMVRASYGASGVDPMFAENVINAKNNGIYVGAYHYCYAVSVEEAIDEANHFINTISGYDIDYPVALHIEDPSGEYLLQSLITEIALAFLQATINAGYYSMIYSSSSWFAKVFDDERLQNYDHWVFDLGPENTYKGKTGIWKYSVSGTIKGIDGYVGLDYAYNDYAAIVHEKNKSLILYPESAPELDTLFKVDDIVYFNGYLYEDSHAEKKLNKFYENYLTFINDIVDMILPAPYLLGNSIGWAMEKDLTKGPSGILMSSINGNLGAGLKVYLKDCSVYKNSENIETSYLVTGNYYLYDGEPFSNYFGDIFYKIVSDDVNVGAGEDCVIGYISQWEII